ncbi:MAG TPA: DUF805 domain-containing protein [Nocardioidaceae bacterium]|nr:DUF805 domain-containing protein [Nocardioidaceae bacterium]
MSFPEAVRACLTQYVTFTGRARRSEYWWFFLFVFLASLVASMIDFSFNITLFQVIVGLALILPHLAVIVRRLHDTDRSGWWILIGLIPVVGTIVLLVFMLIDSDPQTNRFGASPKTVGPAPSAGPVQA